MKKNEIVQKEWMNPDNLNLKNKQDCISFLSHKKAYEEIVQYIKDKKVLEIGCGAGYGAKFMSHYACEICTVDLDRESLKYAKENNFSKNIRYIHANVLEGIPLDDNSFDIAVSFQVFEHIDKKNAIDFLNEIKRILKDNSLLIITTPNRKIRLQPFQKPINKYHKIEYSGKGLYKVLIKAFKFVEIIGLRAVEEIEIEKRKTKQTIFQAYIRNPIRKIILETSRILGIRIIVRFFENRTKKGTKLKLDSKEIINYSTEDFFYSADNIDKSIDLMAICRS